MKLCNSFGVNNYRSLSRVILVLFSVQVLHANRAPHVQFLPVATSIIDIYENTTVGTVIKTLKATDADNDDIKFSINDETTKQLISLGKPRGNPSSGVLVDILLNSTLDSDYVSQCVIVVVQ
ncbi:hypothetical protein ScPMuIL_003495 [Solemya velum]